MPSPVGLTFLGGLGQIGRNCTVVEVEGKLLLIDCGQMFARDTTPGVETILPDFTLLRERAADVVGCVCTHGHEDHIGALPYLLRHLSFPVYATPFTLGLVRHKLSEARLEDRAELVEIGDGDRRRIGPFDCEFLAAAHSTPSGVMTILRTPQGVLVHSGDFKIDRAPVDGRITDLDRLGEVSRQEGVRVLLADSTNADQPGETRSETAVGEVLAEIFDAHPDRRLIVASFASHIHRLQQVADLAVEKGRTVVPVGLSMVRNVKLARDLGVMRIPDASIAAPEDLGNLDPTRTCIICTGSQGEARSALWQMAQGESRAVRLGVDDLVVFSSHPIPGNEAAVARLRNGLARLGVEVIHSGVLEVHTSGHAKQGELATLHRTARPEWFVPVHGEHAHLFSHAGLAQRLGMPEERVLLCLDGDRLALTEEGLSRTTPVSGAEIYVDGTVGGVDAELLRERRILGQSGFVAVIVGVDPEEGRRVDGPVVVSRGWATDADRDQLHAAVEAAVAAAVERMLAETAVAGIGIELAERVVRRAAGSAVNEVTRRRPMIIPVVRLH